MAFCQGRPHFLWDWEVRDLPGKARSSCCLPGGGLPGLRCAFGDPISFCLPDFPSRSIRCSYRRINLAALLRCDLSIAMYNLVKKFLSQTPTTLVARGHNDCGTAMSAGADIQSTVHGPIRRTASALWVLSDRGGGRQRGCKGRQFIQGVILSVDAAGLDGSGARVLVRNDKR